MAQGSSNPTTDLKKVAGTSVDVNTGNASAGTQRVVLASNQPAVAVSAGSLPLPSGAATEATLDARTGSLTEAAPANDTASSGLNGRLQRIAQRITSLIALIPAALGQGTMAQSFRVVLPSDQTWTGATNLGKQEDAAHASGDVGIMALGRRIDTAAASSGSSGDYETMNMSAEGAQWATLTPTTTSGLSIARDIDLDNGALTVVKASAGNLYGYYLYNTSASTVYVKFYNAASGTLGTGTPVMTIPLPVGGGANVGFPYPVAFSSGICVGAGTGVGDADNTDPGTNAVIANIFYK